MVVKGASNDDMRIIEGKATSEYAVQSKVVLMSALEEFPVRLPRSIANVIMKVGHFQATQMTVSDFVHYAGIAGNREKTLRDASRHFMNALFTTDLRQMQADLRQRTIQTLTDPLKRAGFNQFLDRMHAHFSQHYSVFAKLDKIGTFLLNGFENTSDGLHSVQLITQPPHLLHRITTRLSKIRPAERTASDSFAIHDDAGAYFLTKQIVEFVDAFVAVGSEWNSETPHQCQRLELRVHALRQCIPSRYRWAHDFAVTLKVIELDGVLGSVHYGRETFVPIFLECLDMLSKFGAIQSCEQNTLQTEQARVDRIQRDRQLKKLISQRRGDTVSVDLSSVDDDDDEKISLNEEASVVTSSTHDQEDDLDGNGNGNENGDNSSTNDLFTLLEHNTTRMTTHLSSIQQYVSLSDLSELTTKLSLAMPIGNEVASASFDFSVQMQSVLTNWVLDSAAKMDPDHPTLDFLLRVPFQMAALHAVMELWESTVENTPTELLPPPERSHLDTQFISTMCEQLVQLGESVQSITVHQTRCASQRKRCIDYINWVHDERKKCVKHCQESKQYLRQCSAKQKQAAHVVNVASALIIAPLERPDGVDVKRVAYFQSAVVMNLAAYDAATIELEALEETLNGIRNSNDDCNTSLDRIGVVLDQQSVWLAHCNTLHSEIMSRLEEREPDIHLALAHIEYLETAVASIDRVQLVRAATRALDDFEEGEHQRNELLAQRETSIHTMRSQSRVFRKHCREYLLHLWFALDKNIRWYASWEKEFQIKLENPCSEVEAKISVLYDQVKLAKELNQEKVILLKQKAEVHRTEWHATEKVLSNFWWFKFTEGECAWFEKWLQWHHSIRLEKKIYLDKRKEEAKIVQAQEAVTEAKQAAVAKFQVGDVVEGKCKGWHQWWIGEIRKVEDLIPGSGLFTYYLKFQDGERIRGVEERRLKSPTYKPPEQLFAAYEESMCATSDYTNDSLGNPGSEESDFYFETDSDIPPPENMDEEKKQQQEEKAKRKKKKLKERRKNAKNRVDEKKTTADGRQNQLHANQDGTAADSDDGVGDEMGSESEEDSSSSSEEEQEPEPLQIVIDYAIEFIELYPNAGYQDIPWEKIFKENGFVDSYSEFEVDRLMNIYNYRKMCYFPVEKIEKKDSKNQEDTKSIASIPSDLEYAPLIVAALQGEWNRVRTIVDSGANINMVADDGETPLIAAARNGHGEVVRLLVELGALVNKKTTTKIDIDGGTTDMSAALVARRVHREDIVELLYELGASHVPRDPPPIKWFGHRKLAGLEVSETESDRSSDRHSWDLDADHPLDFGEMFKPVSVRRAEKKKKRRHEKIAERMHATPLTETERKELLFSSSRRTALQEWDAITTRMHDAAADATNLVESFTFPFKPNKWNAHTKTIDQDPIKLLPEQMREKLVHAMSHLHRLRLAIDWRDYPTSCALASQLVQKFNHASIAMNEAGGVMHFASGPWNTLAATELSLLSQISSAVPAMHRMLLHLQSRYDVDILEYLPDSEKLVTIGKYVDPATLDVTQLRRLLKIFHRLATLPRIKAKSKQQLRKEAKQEKMEAAAYSGESKQQSVAELPAAPKNRDEIEAEALAKLAAATLEEKILETKMIVKGIGEFLKGKISTSTATMKYHVRHRYNALEGSITWEQFVDCATVPLPSRLEIRRKYHAHRALKTKSLLQKKFLKWAKSFKTKMYMKYGQDLPGLRWIKKKIAATRIQNWYRCLVEYYGFLKQKYVFDQCKKVQEAGLVLQNLFWYKYGGLVSMRERVTRDFVMVWDPESEGTFYVDVTCMMGRMMLPLSVKGCLRQYSEEVRFTTPVNIRAVRPWQLTERAEVREREQGLLKQATVVQAMLEQYRGKVYSKEQIVELMEADFDAVEETRDEEKDRKENGLAVLALLVEYEIIQLNGDSGRYRVSVAYHSEIFTESAATKK